MKKETDCPKCKHMNMCKYKDEAMRMQYKGNPFTLKCEYYEPAERETSGIALEPIENSEWWRNWRLWALIGYAVVILVLVLLESLGVLPC